MNKIKVAIIGTQGIPNKYGGFETLVEYLALHLSDEFEITIFCSSKTYKHKLKSYNNCKLVYINYYANGFQSIPYDIISLIKAYKKYDKILILGSSGGIILPFLSEYKRKFILNFGGLDWQRSKWGYLTRKFLKLSEYLAVKYSSVLVADNIGIQDYITQQFNRNSVLIEYGGDQVKPQKIYEEDLIKYPFLTNEYAFSLARIQPDNNIEMILESFLDKRVLLPIVFVGNWNNSRYGIYLKKKYQNHSNIFLLDAIYDAVELNKIRSNCKFYIHGHSAGGTNPSLVEAMNLGLPIIAFSSKYNKYTTEGKALYFNNKTELCNVINSLNELYLQKLGSEMLKIANNRYKWELITRKYGQLFKS